ncbi:TetR/AcrR family transcriptional regulator C-terminal ligand-binding domain-containing protein [Streptomyces sp. NPDC059578]|uniref:TetR/AcrR family transcriptional regulator C-terminal ligand-binding domain-containing protein n=1 Tax=Streptomyces sp. NPDC059578 TaxID=3346874 RepID=UPI0036C33087
MQALVDEFRAPGAAAALPGLLADFAADPELKARIRGDFLAPAKARLSLVFERAAARGEITDFLAYAIVFLVVTLSVGWPRPLLRLPQWMLFLPVCALTVAGTV